MFQSIVNRVNATLHRNAEETKEEHEKKITSDEEQQEVESVKNESKLITMLEKARALYIEKGLVGNISITSSFTIFYASVSCDIDGVAERDTKMHEHSLTKSHSIDSTFDKMAVSCVNRCISMLERRAVAYGGKPYCSKISLTNTIYASLPILSMMTISISCTATVASLKVAAAMEAAAAAAATTSNKGISAHADAVSSSDIVLDTVKPEVIAETTQELKNGDSSETKPDEI